MIKLIPRVFDEVFTRHEHLRSYLKGRQFNLDKKLELVGVENCAISEITLAELAYGASKSNDPEKNYKIVEAMSVELKVLPIFNAIKYTQTRKPV